MYHERPQISFLPIIFFTAQIILTIALFATLSNLFGTTNITTDINSYSFAPISNLRTTIPEIPTEIVTTIERQLYLALLSNSPQNALQDSTTSSSIVADSVIRNNFDSAGVTLIGATIDVPVLKQSYSFYYGYPQEGNNDFQAFYTILCPVSKRFGTYSDFKCRGGSFMGDVTKKSILSTFLPYFYFAHFSVSLDPDNINRIIIRPSITYNNNQKTKDGFIKEAQDAIESLGMDSGDYEYYVRTAADIDYENKDR